MKVILALHSPDPDFRGLNLIAATRNPHAIAVFRTAILRELDRAVQEAETPNARFLASVKKAETIARLDMFGLGQNSRKNADPAITEARNGVASCGK